MRSPNGAINAASVAYLAENFDKAVTALANVWRDMRASDIYRGNALEIGAFGARWLSMLVAGWLVHNTPQSLLDNSPLRDLLVRNLDFSGIERPIFLSEFFTTAARTT